MARKQPMQADGGGRRKGAPDGVSQREAGGTRTPGESGGGPYPNPHSRKKRKGPRFMDHGGQSEIAYHGTGQLGETDVKGQENRNAPAKED
ncbi:hypothetical protein BSL82_06060 [Tardibacter chloracetimidivorans]|uniref:Uncharacterized protein n=1 Tax=Tardibacter chloracetimidivorans TaxID=1921510 RepID=A0A1L3ZTG4_9SPHN|nr:hypothetical protein [Tardibacter chloracetimidivorans]API58931.1 hypothetical protein BSL82_06060 [Tardibacter chloracetimidivorans]